MKTLLMLPCIDLALESRCRFIRLMKNYVSIQIISLIAYSLIDKLWLVRSKAAAVTYCNLSNTTAVFVQPHGNSLAWGRSPWIFRFQSKIVIFHC